MKDNNNKQQLLKVMAWTYAPVLGLLAIAGLQTKVPISVLVRDIFATAEIPSYTGFFSNLGVMTWCITATVCSLTVLTLRNQIKKLRMNFLIYAGSLSVMFMLDDFFLLHENYYSRIIHETKVYLIYIILLAIFLFTFRRIIARSEFIFLILAIGFWGASISFDVMEFMIYYNSVSTYELSPGSTPELFYLVEDGSKLMGIVSWAVYMSRFCLNEIQTRIIQPKIILRTEEERQLNYSFHRHTDSDFS